MSECNPVTYHNVTPDVFECMKKKLKDAGIHVSPGNSGDMEGSGVKAHFVTRRICNNATKTVNMRAKTLFWGLRLREHAGYL